MVRLKPINKNATRLRNTTPAYIFHSPKCCLIAAARYRIGFGIIANKLQLQYVRRNWYKNTRMFLAMLPLTLSRDVAIDMIAPWGERFDD